MTIVDLGPVTVAAFEGWRVLFDVSAGAHGRSVVVIGGQMIALHTAEHGRTPVRPTDDVDVVVDVRTDPKGIRWLVSRLRDDGFELDGVSPDGIGHRFTRACRTGHGAVTFDVLAPEGLRGAPATDGTARTVLVPGGTQAIARAETVRVRVVHGDAEISGVVRRPSAVAALIAKAAAIGEIAVRQNRDRDFQDAAALLAAISDPFGEAERLTKADRRRLRWIDALFDPAHPGWALLHEASGAVDDGVEALRVLLRG